MKKYSKLLMIITLEIIIFTIFITLQIEEKNDSVFPKSLEEKTYLYTGDREDIRISQIQSVKTKFKFDPLRRRYYGNNENIDIFSLSFDKNNLNLGDILKYKGPLSDQIYLIFRNSYPLVSLEEMGVNTEEEAYFAIQLALWEVANRTGEAMYKSEYVLVSGIRNYVGETNINDRVYNAASKLVDYVLKWDKNKDSKEVTSKLIVNSEKTGYYVQKSNLKYLLGPFTYEVTNAILKDATITAEDKNGEFQIDIYDDKGEKVIDFTKLHKKNFYVAFPKDIDDFKFTIDVSYYALKVNAYIVNDEDYAARMYTLKTDYFTEEILNN